MEQALYEKLKEIQEMEQELWKLEKTMDYLERDKRKKNPLLLK